MRLTPEQKDSFATNGFLAVEGVIPPEHVAAMRQRIEELCASWDSEDAKRVGMQQEAEIRGASTEERNAAAVRKFSNLVGYEPVFRAHAANPALLDLVEELIGLPIALYADQALLKPPRVGSEKLAHQDNAYFRIVPDEAVITCWGALDDATVENGCMHYLPGTHRLGIVEHEAIPGTPHLVPKEFDPSQAVPVPVPAGSIIFHHACTLHFSPANQTDRWRRAFVCHYARSNAIIPGRRKETLLPLR